MAHPIFDRSTYAWERREAVDLYELLCDTIDQQSEIAMLYAQAGGELAKLHTGQAPAAIWRDALGLLAMRRALRNLCVDVLPSQRRFIRNQRFQATVRAVVDAAPAVDGSVSVVTTAGATLGMLSGAQRQALTEALGSAFPSVHRLRELLDFKLDKQLEDISVDSDYRAIRYSVVKAAEAEGWTADLLVRAREENPGNVLLRDFARDLGLT
jgi:hypothetical protein